MIIGVKNKRISMMKIIRIEKYKNRMCEEWE